VIGRDDRFVCRTEYWLRTNHVLAWRLQTYRFDTNDTVISSVSWNGVVISEHDDTFHRADWPSARFNGL